MSYGPIRAQHSSSSQHDDNHRNLAFLQARTLPALQRVLPTPNVPLLPSSPPTSLSLSENNTGSSDHIRAYVPALARSSSRKLSQDAPYSQPQNSERLNDVGPLPSQRAFQSDNRCTQYSSYGQNSRTGPIVPPIVSADQTQILCLSSFPSSDGASTMPQMTAGVKDFEMSTPSMTLKIDQGPIQIPVGVQAASKAADEKRKRNALASKRFRVVRKERKQEISENTAKLEAQLHNMTEERDHYLRKADFLRDVILRHGIELEPRRRKLFRSYECTLSN